MNDMATQVIVKTRVTFVFRGYGDLTLTDTALIWNKSATSYLAFGAMNTMTDDHVMIPLDTISFFEKYTYLPGGGLKVVNNEGKEYKFSFKHKKYFKIIWDYLSNDKE